METHQYKVLPKVFHCLQPTYKEWKPAHVNEYLADIWRLQPTYKEWKPRWAGLDSSTTGSLQPTYKEWKLLRRVLCTACLVVYSLPIRNGNKDIGQA